MILLGLLVLSAFAVIPAMIANEKGRPFGTWYLYSFLLWPIALVHAFILRKRDVQDKCRKCKKSINALALECPFCGADQVPESKW